METPMQQMKLWTKPGSKLATLMFVCAVIRQYCPNEVRRCLQKYAQRLMNLLDPYIQISIHEYTGNQLRRNEAYTAVEAYLSASSLKSIKRLKAEMGRRDRNQKLVFSMDDHESVTDKFEGVTVWWVLTKLASPSSSVSYYPLPEKRYYKLKFHRKYRKMITETYLEHVLEKGNEINSRKRQKKLYTNSCRDPPSSRYQAWSHIVFKHPATFESIAMEPEKKEEIIEDLLTFSKRKNFYDRIGKAWKRGYLLYGPPGTGKSTLIAAMANLLNYDVYDLELTAVKDNSELRRLLIETSSKSIIVIEDIDCSLDLTGQRKNKKDKPSTEDLIKKETSSKEPKESISSKVTLSGLLNFIDGLWSSCGGERLIVLTTNYVEMLDPALIRSGRMDKHIELSYCNFEGFKVLAKNYLEIEEHPMFDSIQKLMEKTKITPADVAENLMPKTATQDAEICLSNLVRALEEAKNDLKQGEPEKVETLHQDKK